MTVRGALTCLTTYSVTPGRAMLTVTIATTSATQSQQYSNGEATPTFRRQGKEDIYALKFVRLRHRCCPFTGGGRAAVKAADAAGWLTETEARANSCLDVIVRVDRGYLRQKFLLSKSLEAAEDWTYEAVVVRYVTYYAQNQY